MKVQLTHILQQLFHSASLDEVSNHRLEEMTREHPYFNTGHFLLAQKLKSANGEGFEQQSQKAAVYFHDPLWLQWLLNHQDTAVVAKAAVAPEVEWVEEVEEVERFEEIEKVEEVEEAETLPAAPEPEPQPEPEKEPAKPVVAEPLVFDAYYTIDYFASQGIKAPAEVQPDDKLGKQLKSFTEWLKTMKRLPQVVPQTRVDEAEQHDIQQIAAGSLEQKEVVTETMAEVLVKQDKTGEAIAIYEKLSLLDPSKSGYFAAKIANLKAKLI